MKLLLLLTAALCISANHKIDSKLRTAKSKAKEIFTDFSDIKAAGFYTTGNNDSECYFPEQNRRTIECVITDRDPDIGWSHGLKIIFNSKTMKFTSVTRIEH